MLAASIDPTKEKLHVTTMTAQGPMIVMGPFPSDGDILRLEGMTPDGQPIAHIIDVDNLALTISRHPIDDKKDDDGMKIGFVIFDELDARAAEKAKTGKAKKEESLKDEIHPFLAQRISRHSDSLEDITERLTMIGLEVEEVDDKSAFMPFTIAKVLTAEQHPDADKLRVLSVDKGDGKPVQVVCGAPNAKAGLIGAFAGPGTYVPGIDVTLGVGKIRGVKSFGMMCSERELEMSDAHDGIIELPEDAPVGTPFAAYAGLDDPVIEIGLTPNRPDCTGVYGIARI